MKILKTLILLVIYSGSAGAQLKTSSWRITQPAWSEYHERQFGQFVTKIGEAVEKRQCATVAQCLRSSANVFYGTDPKGLEYFSDCADLPYYLRGYFSWKSGLPFSLISEVKPLTPTLSSAKQVKDIRYSPFGNYASDRMDFLIKDRVFKKSYPDAFEILNEIIPNMTSSAFFRVLGANDREDISDFYPVKLNRQGIRPGTVIYDPNGHVAVVYKVTDDGRIFYIDAHPDNSLTMGMFTPKFVRSLPSQGAGFKNFRPLTLVDASVDSLGHYIGGNIVATPNSQLPAFSLEQYFGNQPDPGGVWNRGKFIFNQQAFSYYDYVRLVLMKGDTGIDPLRDMAQLVDDICVSLQDRVAAVEAARTSGVYAKPHPDRLPLNIYGTEGEWEDFATPSRDARLKTSFVDLLAQTKTNMERYANGDATIKYQGANLAADLFAIYAEHAKACQFSYTTTNNQTVKMNLEAARQRLFNMSFDPYHCIELRWGARIDRELAACTNDANKNLWYEKEKWLRNQIERRYEVRTNFSLWELVGPLPGAGLANPPDIDIVGFLKAQMD